MMSGMNMVSSPFWIQFSSFLFPFISVRKLMLAFCSWLDSILAFPTSVYMRMIILYLIIFI